MLGRVTLDGVLDFPRDVQLAVAVASEVPGVSAVVSRLCVPWEQVAARAEMPLGSNLVLIEPDEPCLPLHQVGELRVRRIVRPIRRSSCD